MEHIGHRVVRENRNFLPLASGSTDAFRCFCFQPVENIFNRFPIEDFFFVSLKGCDINVKGHCIFFSFSRNHTNELPISNLNYIIIYIKTF